MTSPGTIHHRDHLQSNAVIPHSLRYPVPFINTKCIEKLVASARCVFELCADRGNFLDREVLAAEKWLKLERDRLGPTNRPPGTIAKGGTPSWSVREGTKLQWLRY